MAPEKDPRPYRGDFGLPFVGPDGGVLDLEGGPLDVLRKSLLACELGGHLAFTVGGQVELRTWYDVFAVNSGNKDAGSPSHRDVGTNPMTPDRAASEQHQTSPVDKGKGKAPAQVEQDETSST